MLPAQARLNIAAEPICSIAQHAEQLAESVEPLVEQRRDGFVGAVARGDAGAAGRDDDLDVRRLPRARFRAPSAGSSRTIRRPTTSWPASVERLRDRVAAGVGLGRARVADRQHEAPDACRRVVSMGLDGHRAIIAIGDSRMI